MKRRFLTLLITLTLVLLILPSTSWTQQRDSLNILRDELQSLHRMFDALNAGDTVYTPYFPMWSIQDRGLKLRIFSAFRNHDISFNKEEPIYIVATPDQQDIADIKIGKAGFGRLYAKFVLSRDLHQTIIEKKYEHKIEVPAGYGAE